MQQDIKAVLFINTVVPVECLIRWEQLMLMMQHQQVHPMAPIKVKVLQTFPRIVMEEEVLLQMVVAAAIIIIMVVGAVPIYLPEEMAVQISVQDQMDVIRPICKDAEVRH